MEHRLRNRICIYVIFFGLINYIAYGFAYAYIQGDARNGGIHFGDDGQILYYVRGHHITHGVGGKENYVSGAVWTYSYIHSISLWPTHAAILISMLILARPHIIATMKQDAWLDGSHFVTVCLTLIVLIAGASTGWFLLDFVRKLHIAYAGSLMIALGLGVAGPLLFGPLLSGPLLSAAA